MIIINAFYIFRKTILSPLTMAPLGALLSNANLQFCAAAPTGWTRRRDRVMVGRTNEEHDARQSTRADHGSRTALPCPHPHRRPAGRSPPNHPGVKITSLHASEERQWRVQLSFDRNQSTATGDNSVEKQCP